MELFPISKHTLDYIKSTKLSDFLPKSSSYTQQKDKFSTSMDLEEEESSTNQPKYNTLERLADVSFPSRLFNIRQEKTSITSIATLSNILVITDNIYLYVFDIADEKTFNCMYTYQMSQNKKKIWCCALSEYNGSITCAVGSDNPSIFILDVLNKKEKEKLTGHKSRIYELCFNPIRKNLLLSASKDYTARIWDIATNQMLVIFGGPKSFKSEVLSIDWNYEGKLFVGAGVDRQVLIYDIYDDSEVRGTIEEGLNNISKVKGKNIKVLIKSKPFFKIDDIHEKLIDCVKFYYQLLLTKSVDGVIKEWLPQINVDGCSYFLVNTYVFGTSELLLNTKFCIFDGCVLVGNEENTIFLFNSELTDCANDELNYNFSNLPACKIKDGAEWKERFVCCQGNLENNIIFFGTDGGHVYGYKIFEK